MTIRELQKEAHETAKEKGWYDPAKSNGEAVLLMHAELSEAAEELRKFGLWHKQGDAVPLVKIGPATVYYNDDKPTKPEGFGIELADCVVRIADTCEYLGIDLEEMLRIKMAYNKTRPHRHGGKTL